MTIRLTQSARFWRLINTDRPLSRDFRNVNQNCNYFLPAFFAAQQAFNLANNLAAELNDFFFAAGLVERAPGQIRLSCFFEQPQSFFGRSAHRTDWRSTVTRYHTEGGGWLSGQTLNLFLDRCGSFQMVDGQVVYIHAASKYSMPARNEYKSPSVI
jgi:hypothetical protein